MNKEEFISELKNIGIEISDKEIKMLDRYYELLKEWNEKINLTSIIDYEDVYLKHFYDSLTLYRDIDLNENLSLCDIGTGAGFPGLVLKIVFPNLKVTLVDSLLKRINFLNIVISELNLKDIYTYHARCEDFLLNHVNSFDIVTSRAVSNLNLLSKMCLPLVKKEGYFIPMKAKCDEELESSKDTINKLHGEIIKIDKFILPKEESTRTILKIKKIKETNENSLKKIRKDITFKK